MPTNQLQADLTKLRRLVDFAEGATTVMPVVLVESGQGLVTIGSSALQKAAAMSAPQIEALRQELRDTLRRLADGDSVTMQPVTAELTLFKTPPKTKPSRRTRAAAAGRARFVSGSVDGRPRDVFIWLAQRLLLTIGVERLHRCPAPDCGKAFLTVTQKRFCSTRCQARVYMRARRAAEQHAAAEAQLTLQRRRKGTQDGKTTRTR
jgi:predicted RNA-binding Zn ribbon-like protein